LEIRKFLSDLGWKGSDLARLLDVSESTVSHWMTGKHETPKAVLLYLDLRLKLKSLV